MSTVTFLLRDRRAQVLLAVCAAALVAAAVWLGPARAAITGVQSGGRLTVTQTGATSSLFKLAGLVPGDVATGEVTLGNDGARGADLALVTEDLTDHLGPGGAPLSSALDLTVEDVSGSAPEAVFRGKLGELGSRGVGRLGALGSRTFRFTVRMPDSGAPAAQLAGDNALMGARVTFALRWQLTEDPAPAAPAQSATVVQSSASTSSGVGGASDSLGPCVSRRTFGIRLVVPRGFRPAVARVTVDGKRVKTVRGKRIRSRVDLRGLPKGRFTVRIVLEDAKGRRRTEVRRYRTCVPKAKRAATKAAAAG